MLSPWEYLRLLIGQSDALSAGLGPKAAATKSYLRYGTSNVNRFVKLWLAQVSNVNRFVKLWLAQASNVNRFVKLWLA